MRLQGRRKLQTNALQDWYRSILSSLWFSEPRDGIYDLKEMSTALHVKPKATNEFCAKLASLAGEQLELSPLLSARIGTGRCKCNAYTRPAFE